MCHSCSITQTKVFGCDPLAHQPYFWISLHYFSLIFAIDFWFNIECFKLGFFFKDSFPYMHMSVLSICMSEYHMHSVLVEIRREQKVPWNWTYRLLWLCRCWEPNPGPFEEQPELLITESSLYPHKWEVFFLKKDNYYILVKGTKIQRYIPF